MKVLVISALAPPLNSPESIQAGRYLSRMADHKVTLVSARVRSEWEPSDPSLTSLLGRVDRHIQMQLLPPVIAKVWQRIRSAGPFPDWYAPFHWQFKQVVKQLHEKPDIILSRSTPFSSHLLARHVALHFQCPWIMHVSDPLVDNPFFNHAASRFQRLSEWEDRCLSLANLITFTSAKTVEHYQKKYPTLRDKFRWLPNVFEESEMNQSPVSFSGPMKLLFTGRLYGARNANAFITAIEKAFNEYSGLRDQITVEFAGHLDPGSISRILNSSASSIRFVGPLGMLEARKAQAAATLLVSIDALDADARSDMFFPSKLADYLAAGRRIIALTRRTSTTHEVVQGRFGWCFDQDNLGDLPELLNQAAKAYADRNTTFFALQGDTLEYSLGRQAPRLLKMMTEVCP